MTVATSEVPTALERPAAALLSQRPALSASQYRNKRPLTFRRRRTVDCKQTVCGLESRVKPGVERCRPHKQGPTAASSERPPRPWTAAATGPANFRSGPAADRSDCGTQGGPAAPSPVCGHSATDSSWSVTIQIHQESFVDLVQDNPKCFKMTNKQII